MHNTYRPAYPLSGEKFQKHIGNGASPDDYSGLTKREYFAGLAMLGIITYGGRDNGSTRTAEKAVEYADELLKQLDQ